MARFWYSSPSAGTSKQRTYWFKKGFDTGDVGGASELFSRYYNDL